MTDAANSSMRIFFALWPGPQLRAKIVATGEQLPALNLLRAHASGPDAPSRQRSWRPVPEHNLHLTLLFLGNQSKQSVHELCQRVEAVRACRFELLLDRFGWFARPKVVWLGADAPSAGIELVQALSRISSDSGMRYQKSAWRPHMSLYRHVRRPPELPQISALHWAPHEFVLLQSMSTQPYRILRRWALTG